MKRMLLIAFGGLAGLIAIVAIGLVLFFPKQQVIALMEQKIEQSTGRHLTLGGDVALTFWPTLGVSANQAALSNPHGFSNAPFFRADKIVFAVAVMPLLTGHIEVKQLILEGADLRLEAKTDGSNNWTFPTEQTPTQHNTLDDLKLDDVRLAHSRIAFQGADASPPLQLENVDASITLTSLDQPAHLQASFDHNGQPAQVTSDIGKPRAVLEQHETPYKLTFTSAPVNATFDGTFDASNGALNGAVHADGSSLRQLLAWIGSPLGPGGGFNAFTLDAQMAHFGDNTALTQAAFHLDAIDAHGQITISAPPNAKLHVGGSLTAPVIDTNPYLPAPPQGQAGGVQASTAWDTSAIDLSGLRAMDADLTLATPLLKFQRMSFTDAQMTLKVARGAADARLTHIALYHGSGTAHLIADGSGQTPRVGVELDVRDVDVQPFLADAVGFDKIQGHGHVIAALAGQGRSQAAIMQGLHGASSFDFANGAVQGVNLLQIAQVISSLQGRPAPSGSSSATQFSDMSANFAVSNGSAATNNLELVSPLARLDGAGIINLGAQTIDMRLEPHAVNTQHTQTASNVLGVPFQISGPWSHPSFAPAIGDLLRSQMQARAGAILGHGDASNPLSALGSALFGGNSTSTTTPSTSTSTATTPQHSTTTTSTTTTTTTSTTTTQTPQSLLNDLLNGHHHH